MGNVFGVTQINLPLVDRCRFRYNGASMKTLEKPTPALFREVVTLNERCDNIAIPKEWFGMRVEVIAFPVPVDAEGVTPSPKVPFRVNRRRLETMRVSSTPELLSENVIRADRDAR